MKRNLLLMKKKYIVTTVNCEYQFEKVVDFINKSKVLDKLGISHKLSIAYL